MKLGELKVGDQFFRNRRDTGVLEVRGRDEGGRFVFVGHPGRTAQWSVDKGIRVTQKVT